MSRYLLSFIALVLAAGFLAVASSEAAPNCARSNAPVCRTATPTPVPTPEPTPVPSPSPTAPSPTATPTPPPGVQTLETAEGVTINVYVDSVTPEYAYELLKGAGLQSHIQLVRMDVSADVRTMSVIGGGCYPDMSQCWSFNSAINIREANLLSTPEFSVGHEYGIVWGSYYRWTVWHGSWDAYLEARGLLGDPRIDSNQCWLVGEMISEDYRKLFGSGAARTLRICNTAIPQPEDVPGLRDFLALTWTNGVPPPGYEDN